MSVTDLSGQILDDRYRVLEPIGAGAMGNVYRAERLKLGRIVAIKVMNESLPDEASSRRRFEREATAMAKLEHPHCASVLDVGVHGSQPYVVMDFVSGDNLTTLIKQGPVPVERAVEITRQVLSGLAHAHELGIVHRDIKPANIVLSHKVGVGDHAKILDFGIARLSDESSNLTSGVILGTPNYMAPEQIRGLLLDGRADLYACGVMLFELLTGAKPFRSANNAPVEVCMMHLNVPAPRLADKLPGREFGALEGIVARALEKDRDRRYATAVEFGSALAALGGRPSYQTPPVGVAVPPPVDATVRLADGPPAAPALPRDLPAAATGPVAATRGVVAGPAAASWPTPAPLAPPVLAPPPAPPVTPARPEGSAPSIAAAPARPASRRGLAIGGAVVAVVLLGGAIVIGTRGGTRAPAVAPAAPLPDAGAAVVAAPEPTSDPVADLVARAGQLAAGGRLKPAIDSLARARRAHPQDARLPFAAGMLYVDKMFFADGIPLLRAAFALEPAYRSDPALIKAVLRGYNATASVDRVIARFLRDDIGAAARPYLEETARSHPNVIVRKRATAELAHF